MLIYNSKKEFLGIDEHDLNALGFSDLSQLKAQADDFADLFVKTPGYIHNFKHVNWIDFIACADSAESPKVIIHANSKNFKCTLDIKVAYLTDEPSSKAYLVHLNNARELTNGEHDNIADDIVNRVVAPVAVAAIQTPEVKLDEEPKQVPEVAKTPEPAEEASTDFQEKLKALAPEPKEGYLEVEEFAEVIEEPQKELPIDDMPIDLDLPLDLNFHDDLDEIEEEPTLELEEESLEDALSLDIEEPKVETKEVKYTEETVYDNGYVYNPQIASDELGLPVDLIEEFIEDFVAQAKEFKAELYTSVKDGDNDNVKILSHKLKGVAANLRIEDAFEVLSTINTSPNITEIETNLDTFYKIVSKLSGEKIVVTKTEIIEQEAPMELTIDEPEDFENNEISIDFKEETEDISNEPSTSTEVQSLEEPEQEDEISIDFKNEELDMFAPSEEPKELEQDDEISIDFKEDDENIDIFTTDDKTDTEESLISDSEVPEKIEMAELIDDEFLNQSKEEHIEVDDTLDIETISDEETQSLENKSIDIDAIELLDEHKTQDNEIINDTSLDIEENKPIQYNKTTVANEIGLSQESFLELFDDYVSEAQNLSDEISRDIEANDFKAWKNKAIKLKGMSDNMRIHDFTKELETLISTQDDEIAKDISDKISLSIIEISKMKG